MAKPTAAPKEELLPLEDIPGVPMSAQPAVDYSPSVTDLQKRLAFLELSVTALAGALAVKDKQHQAMMNFICEMNGRLFCYEMNHGMRGLGNARFDVEGLNFGYPGTFDTYKMVHELTMKKLVGE